MAEDKTEHEQEPNASRSKPLLTIEQQIDHMKSKGITFDLCSEDGAAAYLTDRTYFFKLYAYRELFERRMGGERNGQYIGLDFGHLKMLASLDRSIRYALLPLTLDVEHRTRVHLVREVTERENENGYSLVADYMAHLNHDERRRREGEIRALAADAYCGDLVRKYALPDNMPLWVLLELVSFGTFIDLYLFCSERWGNEKMRDAHYLLRQAKAVRNACAHSSNVLNGLARQDSTVATNSNVSVALAEAGISRRVRTSKMRNTRIQQITTLLYLHSHTVTEGSGRRRSEASLSKLREEMNAVVKVLPHNDTVRSSLGFLATLIDNWF